MKAPLSPKRGGPRKLPPGRSAAAAERLAKALRENLKKRRAQKTARQEPGPESPSSPPVDDLDER